MGFNGTGNHTVRIREDGIDSLIQIGEGLFRIIRPEQVAAHPVAMGAVNHLFCTGCFEKLELPAAIPDCPIHDLQGIPSSCGTAAGDIRRDFQGGAQHTRPADDIGVIPAVVSCLLYTSDAADDS